METWATAHPPAGNLVGPSKVLGCLYALKQMSNFRPCEWLATLFPGCSLNEESPLDLLMCLLFASSIRTCPYNPETPHDLGSVLSTPVHFTLAKAEVSET